MCCVLSQLNLGGPSFLYLTVVMVLRCYYLYVWVWVWLMRYHYHMIPYIVVCLLAIIDHHYLSGTRDWTIRNIWRSRSHVTQIMAHVIDMYTPQHWDVFHWSRCTLWVLAIYIDTLWYASCCMFMFKFHMVVRWRTPCESSARKRICLALIGHSNAGHPHAK